MQEGVDDIEFHFFDPSQPIGQLSGNLPHWRQEGVRYFVTFRLADSIPQDKLRQWQEEKDRWLKRNPPPHTPEQVREFWRLFPERFHRWLDAGYGACVLGKPRVEELLRGVLRNFDGERYELGEHVVMPNHVHAVVSPLPGVELSGILHTWKSYSANKINALAGRRGVLWQKESFDHIVRNAEQLERINAYIRHNPEGK
ncbi:MAG TPA: transposase [Candidatus Hydrogenedentes bacterium]|nr:transposase [Candidatus Hydrogenedentota bacterium]